MQIIWFDKATQDFLDIISYINGQSPQNALIVYDGLIAVIESIVVLPYKFPIEPNYNKENVRFVSKWHYKIIYRIDIQQDKIFILRIFHTSQHQSKIF